MLTVEIQLPAIDTEIYDLGERLIVRTAELIAGKAKALVSSTTHTGRKYARGRERTKKGKKTKRARERFHQASAPGQPFASDTGTAFNAIRARARGKGLNTRAEILGTDYAVFLEGGTAKVAARPTYTPAADYVINTALPQLLGG